MVQFTVCGRLYKNRTVYQIVIATFFLLVLAVVVPTTAILNNSIGHAKQHTYAFGSIDPMTVQDNFDGVVIWANISSISASALTTQVRYSISPVGKYRKDIGGGIAVFADQVTLRSGGKTIKFDSDDLLRAGDVTYAVQIGDVNQYPFDQYLSEFIISMNDKNNVPIPLVLGIVGAVQSWQLESTVEELQRSALRITVYAKRGGLVKFFSIFVVFTMWVLSLTLLVLSTTIWFRDRKIEPPIIGLCASLLFALPAIRNTQPDTPPIGATVDVSGFFFNMAIVAFCAFIGLLNYMVSYRRVKEVPTYQPAPSSDTKQPKDQFEVAIDQGEIKVITQGVPQSEISTLLGKEGI